MNWYSRWKKERADKKVQKERMLDYFEREMEQARELDEEVFAEAQRRYWNRNIGK